MHAVDPHTSLHAIASSEEVAAFAENGFLVVEDVLAPAELAALRAETVRICRGERGKVTGLPAFADSETDAAVIAKTLCVHFPHRISEIMYQTLAQPLIVDYLTALIGANVKCMQSMLFIKSAGKPGQAWHQDEAFIPTRDRSLTAAWMALDDATPENGCLWAIPGSHKHGVLWPFREHDDERYDCAAEAFDFPYTDEDGVMIPAKAGAVVFFNGYLLHRSLPNYAQTGFRRSLVNHYMSAESLLPWRLPTEGQSMGTADFRDIVLVAGEDPYAYKGVAQSHFCHVRPDKEGGCQWPTEADGEADLRMGDAPPVADDGPAMGGTPAMG